MQPPMVALTDGMVAGADWRSLLLSEHGLNPQGVRAWPVPPSSSSSRVFYSPLPQDGPSVCWRMFGTVHTDV